MATSIKAKLKLQKLGQTNINTCRMSELNEQNIICKSNKIVQKIAKLQDTYNNILSFLVFYYRDASLLIIVPNCPRNCHFKNQTKINQHVLNGRTDFLVMIKELLRFLDCI